MSVADLALLVAGGLFFVFILLKLSPLFAGPRPPEWEAAKRRVEAAKRKAKDVDAAPVQRAQAWREAAVAALQGMQRPDLAARYAHRAERAQPGDAETVGILALALRRGQRFQALERLLWRHLAKDALGDQAYERAFRELVRLYEGPLRRPERAEALKRLHDRMRPQGTAPEPKPSPP